MSERSDLGAAAAIKTAGASAARARERELVRNVLTEIAQGCPDGYARIVELYQHRVFNLVLMVLRDRAAAEDIVQDAFLRAYTHLHMYDVERDFYPWLATIAIRLAQNWKRRVRAHVPDESDPDRNVATASNVLEDVLIDERARRLWRAVGTLPSAERIVVVMYYRQDMKVEEIARAIGVTSGTVKTMLFRARAKIRVAMQDELSVESSI